jgi:hypothetical protein
MATKDERKKTPAEERASARSNRFNNDYDLYDWSGKRVDSGAEVRKKGSDR